MINDSKYQHKEQLPVISTHGTYESQHNEVTCDLNSWNIWKSTQRTVTCDLNSWNIWKSTTYDVCDPDLNRHKNVAS
jgi:hypothetical protein